MSTSNSDLTRRALLRLAGDRYAFDASGVELLEVGDGTAMCRLAVEERHLNARGVVMGGALFTMADLAFAAAANSGCIENDTPFEWVTLDSNIHFLLPVTSRRVTAHCRRVRQGRRTCLFLTEITDEEGRLMALVQSTGMRIV